MTDERMPRPDEPGQAPPRAPSPTAPAAADGAAAAPASGAPVPYGPERPGAADGAASTPAREFDVPYDTAEIHGLPTGQLLAVGRPMPEPYETGYEDEDEQRRVYSQVAAVLGVLGAAASLFVGWMLPLSLAAIVFGVLGLRREEHGRTSAFVGIGTGVAGLVFSGVWIGYYAIVFGALSRA
ncbi:hypothetical protein [Agromyces sp. GXS1127]|uniref:hypothetical protein n=1 Tax=Agromyces sp. GXS1127 TaxID=3424181 RepID=UPI003D31C78D